MEILQIQSSIPKHWIKTLQNTNSTPISNIQNSILINKSKREIVEFKCKDYYWHLIKNSMHRSNAFTAWENIYTNFKSKDSSFWKTFFKVPFICSQHISIQAFQNEIVHRTLPCNEWFKNIKIKPDCNTRQFSKKLQELLIKKVKSFFCKKKLKTKTTLQFPLLNTSHEVQEYVVTIILTYVA